MYNRKKRWISGFLSFVMVMTMVLEILPPIKVGAAEFSISVPKDGDTYWLEDMSQPYNILYEKYEDAAQHWVTITDLSDYSDIFETITESEIVPVDRNLFEYGGEYRVTVIPLDNLGDPIGGGTFSISNEFSVHDEMYLNFSENDMQVSSESNTYYIDVETNNDDLSWTIGESVSWLTFSPASGTGSTEVKVKVSNYDETEERVAYVNLQNKNYDFLHQLKVTQSGIDYTPLLEVTEDSLIFSSEAGDIKTFKVKSNESWELDYPDWVTCEPDSKTITAGNTNTTTVTVTTISENTSSSANRGTIYIETDNCETEVEVTQEGSDTPEQEERNPTINFNISPTTVTEGEAITFSGMADGDGYIITAASIGIAYYESESAYDNGDDPLDTIYLKPENIINSETFDYSDISEGAVTAGETVYGKNIIDGSEFDHHMKLIPGFYTFTAHAYSDEYGKEFDQVTKKVTVEADEEIQEDIQLDSFPITNTETTVTQGSSYMLEWNAPANAPDGTTYSIFVWEYSDTTEVGSTTDTWFEIPSICFANSEIVAITVYANADGYKQSECEKTLNVTVISTGTETPCVTSVVPNPAAGDMNTTYTFTAYAENTDTVVFYMNSTKIASVTGSNGEFVCSYSGFRKAGTRTVFAYPVDSNGNEVRTNGCFASAEITVEAEGTLENIKYITESYQNIDVNSSFELAWNRPENAPEDIDISYIVYVHNDDGQVGSEYEVSGESTVISASYFAEEGRYTISVYAVADNWSQSEYSAITVYVEASVPTISGYRLSHTTIPQDGSFTVKGIVDGNGDDLTEILVKAINTSSGTSIELYSDSLNDSEFDLADIPALCPADSGLTETGTYTISVYAKTVGASSATLLGKSSLYISADSMITLDTPELNGTSTLEYGENYIISWNYDAAVDYYSILVGGYPTKMTADASEGSYSVPASIFKKLSNGSSYTCTLYVTAMSYDTDNYLSSATAEKKITVAAKSEATAIIKSAEIVDLSADKVIVGGTEVEFEVVTSQDVTALRMKDGAGSFIINTWTTGYTDSGDDRIWKVTQKVNYAGGSDVSGAKRMLTFYSMIGEVEYNTYNISFYCQKGDTIGTFSVLTPKNESVQDEGKSLRITWSKPQNTEVDRYILEVVHNNQAVVREEVEGKCEYTLDGSYLVRDNNAWKIQITARKDAGQWSESSAYTSFTLKCTHEKRNPSSERVLSYTNIGNEHSVVVEITSTCEGCGLKIVEEKLENRTEEHKFVDLTEGGKVCNRCWYLVNDGTFTDTTEYIANAKANACTNVGSDGKPYGVQYVNGDDKNIRKVFAGDKVTILGKLNGCCLVQYPVSGGYWYGFVEESIVTKNIKYKTIACLDGNQVKGIVYDTETNKYYCPVIESVQAFGGNVKFFEDLRNLILEIYNPIDNITYTAQCLLWYEDRVEVEFWNGHFSGDIVYCLDAILIDDVAYIELDRLAIDICGAERISELEFAVDHEKILMDQQMYEETLNSVCGIEDILGNWDPLGRDFYKTSLNGVRANALIVLQNFKDAIFLQKEAYINAIEKLTTQGSYYIEDWFDLDCSLVQSCVIDNNIQDVIIKILTESEETYVKTIFDKGEELNKELSEKCNNVEDTLNGIVVIINFLADSNKFSQVINEFVLMINKYLCNELGWDDVPIKVDSSSKKYTIPKMDELTQALSIASDALKIREILYNYLYSIYLYHSNYEVVEYLKSLQVYLEKDTTYGVLKDISTVLDIIIKKCESISPECLGDLANFGIEKLISLGISQICKSQFAILKTVGATVEFATNQRETIDTIYCMKITNAIIDQILLKIHDIRVEYENKKVLDTNELFMSVCMWGYTNIIMNDYSLDYCGNVHKNTNIIYIMKKLMNPSVCTIGEYTNSVKEENDLLSEMIKNTALHMN